MTLPAQPTGLTTSNITADTVKLTWNTVEPHGADRFLIQYRPIGTASWVNAGSTWQKQYTVSGLVPSSVYEFRVYSEAGFPAWGGTWSPSSSIVQAQTLPEQPTLTASNVTSNSVYLSWTVNNPHGADCWLLQQRVNGGNWVTIAFPGQTDYVVSNLTPNTTYQFQVYSDAYLEPGNPWTGLLSLPSNTVTVTTQSTSSSLSPSALQAAFYNATRTTGDYDNYYGLQCVDLYKWFIENYTTLISTSGNGKDCAGNLANANGLSTSTTPTPYSIFSVAGGVYGFGSDGSSLGHTGLVLSVNTANQTCVVLETGNGFQYKNPNSQIKTYPYNMAGLTFVDVSPYLK